MKLFLIANPTTSVWTPHFDPSSPKIISKKNIINDEQDNALIRDEQRQLEAETRLCEEPNIDEVDITGTIASSRLTSVALDETMSEYAGSLPEDPINFASISRYLNSVDDYEGGARSERLPVTPPEFDLDPDLQSLSPHLQTLQLNPTSLNKANESSRAFRERIHENQPHANERSIRQYRKQRAVKSFKVGESVSVAVSALDRVSTDDKRIFRRVKKVHNGPSYEIQTILDRNFPTSELMPLPSTIDLEIPVPAPDRKITLHAIAARESTTDKVPVFCKCKDKRSWCSTRRYACFKAEIKCGVACHGGE